MNRLLALSFGLIVSAAASNAEAAGFYITEVGTPGSVGTAGVINPTNDHGPDSVLTNPAGLVWLEERAMTIGFMAALPTIEFDPDVAEAGGSDGDNAGDNVLIPSMFASNRVSDRWAVGLGLSAPQGGGVDYGSDFVGRYGATKVELTAIGFGGAVGFRVTDRLSIGAGASLVQTTLNQNIAINFANAPDGLVKIKDAQDWGVWPYVGLQYHFTDSVVLGLVYRAEFDSELDGDFKLRNLPIPAGPDGDIEVDWTNPQWLEAGLRFGNPDNIGWGFALSGGWQEWSEFSDNQLAVSDVIEGGPGAVQTIDRDWDDTWYAGVAAFRNNGKYLISFGMLYDSSPVEDDKRTIDFPVDEQLKFSASIGWRGKGIANYSIGATLIMFGDSEIDQTAQGVRFTGEFDPNAIFFLSGTVRINPHKRDRSL
jgi:long-chain fatty acid transport protein